jgi:pSer/pThr/pTyr-binding forkhead associated (FHA) protein/ABC-type multidrug transport system ATPase subunit
MAADRLIFEQGPQAGQVVVLADRPLVFGREETADVVVNQNGVSRQHARLTRETTGYRIEDLGSRNGTYVNDNRIQSPQLLADGDRVRLGPEVVLRVELAPKADATVLVPDKGALQQRPSSQATTPVVERAQSVGTQPSPPRPGRLSIATPDGQTTDKTLAADEITLGRSNENDIVLNAPIVSRRHLRLRRQGSTYMLIVESKIANPVFVNGEQVRDQQLLQDGDTVSLGYVGGEMTITLRYQAPEAASQAANLGAAARAAAAGDVHATQLARSGARPFAPEGEANKTIIGEVRLAAAAAIPPQLVVTTAGKPPVLYNLTQDHIRIGRSPDNDIVLDNPFVSRSHAEIERRGQAFFIVPAPAVGNPVVLDGKPVLEATRLQHGGKLRIGGYGPGEMVTLVFLSPADEPGQANQQTIQFSESKVASIGRDKENEVVLNAPSVSRIHAQVERIGQRYRVRDLGSSNGTFVNGTAIRGDTWVTPGDSIYIGPFRLQVGEKHITQFDESQGGMRVEARELKKQVRKDLNVLQDISLVFEPREFVVVVGQSGGGKSTLVDAIAGYRPATHGRVIVNDTIDVYKNFDAIRNTIGYVPQRDIIHMELTVFQALDYAAQLRMPADTTLDERHQRIGEVLESLDLAHRRDTQISELSGGQQKRVSIGVELLNKPGLFFLDEPTSGLDPGTETELMQLMRRLADQGRTIVLITHATKNVMLADRVVFLARGGYLAWFGPPEEALAYFDQYRGERERRTKPMEFDDIYNLLDRPEQGSGQDWADRYRKHEAYQKYIAGPLGDHKPATPAQAAPVQKVGSRRQSVSALRQFFILSARNIKILTRDRATLALMLLTAPLMASLDFILAFGVGRNPFSYKNGDFNHVLVSLIMLTNTAILVGGLTVARELIKEREIYKRERMVNLHLSSYISSKLWFALLLALYQSFWFTFIRHVAFDMPGGPPERLYFFITVFLMVTAGMMIGLFTSAIAPNADSAPLILTMFIVPQVVLSGALVPLPDYVSSVASSRWTFQAAIAISGMGSDVAADVCWVDMTADQRKALTRTQKDSQCKCMGVNAVRQGSCNFPGLGQYYDPAIDAAAPVKPTDPGAQPQSPVFPDAPAKPANQNDPQAMQAYLKALDDYNAQATKLRNKFNDDLKAYGAKTDTYKTAIEDYQKKLADYESARATAIGSAESVIRRFYDDYGWTFVNQKDQSVYLGTLLRTWAAQLTIISVFFAATVIAQKSRDIR